MCLQTQHHSGVRETLVRDPAPIVAVQEAPPPAPSLPYPDSRYHEPSPAVTVPETRTATSHDRKPPALPTAPAQAAAPFVPPARPVAVQPPAAIKKIVIPPARLAAPAAQPPKPRPAVPALPTNLDQIKESVRRALAGAVDLEKAIKPKGQEDDFIRGEGSRKLFNKLDAELLALFRIVFPTRESLPPNHDTRVDSLFSLPEGTYPEMARFVSIKQVVVALLQNKLRGSSLGADLQSWPQPVSWGLKK